MKEYNFLTQTGILIKAVSLEDLIKKLCSSGVFTSGMSTKDCMEAYAKQVPDFDIPTDDERAFIKRLIRYGLLQYIP